MPRYGVQYERQLLDPVAVFGRRAPLVVEIGSGMGETTATIAAANPERDYLAIEVHVPGVGSLLRQVGELGLTNLRLIQHDAVEVMREMIAPESLAAVHVFFPDPWPKKRHHKRRLIQPAMARLVAERLAPGGIVHLATDWHEYADQILEVLTAEPLLSNPAGGFAERPASRPQTKFEKRGQRLGHPVRDLIFQRVSSR
jgi:tRNA (guanine-N7-)-methyltransferase